MHDKIQGKRGKAIPIDIGKDSWSWTKVGRNFYCYSYGIVLDGS